MTHLHQGFLNVVDKTIVEAVGWDQDAHLSMSGKEQIGYYPAGCSTSVFIKLPEGG
jgi:hypothetical protein